MDSTPFCFLVFWLMVVGAVVLLVRSRMAKGRKEAALKEAKPELWLRLKEMEHDQRRLQHENRKMGVQTGAAIVGFLLRRFMR